ncbi:hypothetical protein CHS0354_030718, partial [Potamilus streckersoni]
MEKVEDLPMGEKDTRRISRLYKGLLRRVIGYGKPLLGTIFGQFRLRRITTPIKYRCEFLQRPQRLNLGLTEIA